MPDSTNADADTLLKCGIYRVVSGTNLPDGAYAYGHLIVIGEYRKLQIYIPYGDTKDNMRNSLYVRTRLTDSWFNWIKFQGAFL